LEKEKRAIAGLKMALRRRGRLGGGKVGRDIFNFTILMGHFVAKVAGG
jgi:hypothetical protein